PCGRVRVTQHPGYVPEGILQLLTSGDLKRGLVYRCVDLVDRVAVVKPPHERVVALERSGIAGFPVGRNQLGNLPLGRWGVVLAVRRGRVSVHLIPQCGKVRYGTVRLWLWFGAMIGDLFPILVPIAPRLA